MKINHFGSCLGLLLITWLPSTALAQKDSAVTANEPSVRYSGTFASLSVGSQISSQQRAAERPILSEAPSMTSNNLVFAAGTHHGVLIKNRLQTLAGIDAYWVDWTDDESYYIPQLRLSYLFDNKQHGLRSAIGVSFGRSLQYTQTDANMNGGARTYELFDYGNMAEVVLTAHWVFPSFPGFSLSIFANSMPIRYYQPVEFSLPFSQSKWQQYDAVKEQVLFIGARLSILTQL